VPHSHAADAVDLLHRSLTSVAGHWAAGSGVRFVAEVAVVPRWSDAK
jgi:DNA polymerase-1